MAKNIRIPVKVRVTRTVRVRPSVTHYCPRCGRVLDKSTSVIYHRTVTCPGCGCRVQI